MTLTKNRGVGVPPTLPPLSPISHLPYTLPSSVSRKPFVCRSYENTRGVGGILPILELIPFPSSLFTFHALTWNPFCKPFAFRFMHGMGGYTPPCIPSFNRQTPFAAGGKVKNAIAHCEYPYFGELPISSMTKNYLEAAIEIAQEAGKILIEELSRPLHIAYKGSEVDLVTQADKRSERFIVERLTKYFPDHAIAAEEGTGHESASASEFRWHVDPLDGTTNYAHGYPCFSVSIALAQRDLLLAAAVFNPFYNELFTAARGEGAAFNGKKVHVSRVATLSTSLLCTGFPVRNRKASPNLQYYGDFTQQSHGVRRDGSAA